jgi:hypothetical protein
MIAATSAPRLERLPSVLELARRGEAAAALDALHGRVVPRGLACVAHGWTLARPQRAASAVSVVIGTRAYAIADVALTERTLPALQACGLAAVRVRPARGAPWRPAPGVGAAVARTAAELRLGLALHLSDVAQAHLAQRVSADVPLLQHQLVKAALADAAIELLLAQVSLDALSGSTQATARVQDLIGQATRRLLDLLGAAGYVLPGPGALGSVSDLVENVLVHGASNEEAA